METKLRLELTFEELSSLVRLLSNHQDGGLLESTETIRKKYLKAYFRHVKGVKLASIELNALTGNPVMDMIIDSISRLTGVPSSQIKPSSDLDELGVSEFKKTKLRIRVNKYIEAKGGDTFIADDEIQNCTTVQDVYELVIPNLP